MEHERRRLIRLLIQLPELVIERHRPGSPGTVRGAWELVR
jgi:hypothetical protein